MPTEGEIRVAKAQLVGWLEGLFHGIQATLFAQQLAARQQLEQMRQLPGGPRAARLSCLVRGPGAARTTAPAPISGSSVAAPACAGAATDRGSVGDTHE